MEKKTPEETAKLFNGMVKAMVKGNPKPKAKPKKSQQPPATKD